MNRSSQHKIPPKVNNSTIRFLINERIRNETDQEILRQHWFQGRSFQALAETFRCSLSHIKDVVYGYGDPLLIEAAEIDEGKKPGA